MGKNVIVTGGLGYIGSHAVIALISSGYNPIIVDNLVTSKKSVLFRLEKISATKICFHEFDVRDSDKLGGIIRNSLPVALLHFAAFKSVPDSVVNPDKYYDNNVIGLLSVLKSISYSSIDRLVFSSSCTVYGNQVTDLGGYSEKLDLKPSSPYGKTKRICEDILTALTAGPSNASLKVGILRYFNPVGAHVSGLIGDDPIIEPSCLMPRIAQVASGRLNHLAIYGSDYATKDGTCIRDFVHVEDVAEAHVASLNALEKTGSHVCNIGTGRGYSVLEVVNAFKRFTATEFEIKMDQRRDGDVPHAVADCRQAARLLNWTAKRTLEDMCVSAWGWEKAYLNQTKSLGPK